MFITFEGLDCSGKSTQAKLLFESLKSRNFKCVLLREPGGTKISEKIRKILLDKNLKDMTALTEFMLFSASRSQLVSEVIKPFLEKNYIVICDRYFDSSTAYQAYGGKLDLRKVRTINHFCTGGLKPDLTFLIDLKPQDCLKRISGRLADRMENKNISYFKRVYKGFKKIASENKKRFIIIDGNRSIEQISKEILYIVENKLNEK